MNLERGFRRITTVLSVLGFLPLALFALLAFLGERSPLEDYVPLYLAEAAVVLGALPWGVFYLVRWIVNGFRKEPGGLQ